ncbi:MAG: SurA N-terminal domain-containing protein [Coriobacteriia bacterium]|nr:SurA N-terminal domain-containing protein [Coriobacteriia bacterium]MCL2537403.1 SurA N-terminal domain-containing protein [Coriobacteriia bacterium]
MSFMREKFESGKKSESRGDGSRLPGEEELEDYEHGEAPDEPDYDDLDLSWGTAKMPDFSEEESTSLPVARADHKSVYAVASAVDSTDATVVSAARADAGSAGTASTGRSGLVPLLIVAAVIAAVAVGWFVLANYTHVLSGEVAAKVNGDVITMRELDDRMTLLAEQNPAMFDPAMGGVDKTEARQFILGSLVDDLLMMQEARREGVVVSDAEVQAQVDDFVASFPSEADFQAELDANHITMELFKRNVLYSLSLDGLLRVTIPDESLSDEEVRSFYDEHLDMYTEPAAKRTSHILLPLDDRARATDLLAELRDSDNLTADFARIAEESSADAATASQGGDAGWPRAAEQDQRDANYQAAVAGLSVGQLSDLVRSEAGYYIILVTDERAESVRPYDEVAPAIRDMILTERRNQEQFNMLERLRSEATIEILDPELAHLGLDQQAPAAGDEAATTEAAPQEEE